jgi:hypothetical protein
MIMREFKRRQPERAKPLFIRGADGRLRAATGDDDIGDIWAEQQRIRLREAIETDKLKREKKKLGWRRFYAKRAKKKLTEKGVLVSPAASKPSRTPETKLVEIKISLPSTINMPKVRLPKPTMPASVKALPGRIPKRAVVAGASVVVCALMVYGGYHWYSGHQAHNKQVAKSNSSATHGALGATTEQPQYATVLPSGKTIESLGGWHRVSPTGRAPVFAFADSIDGVSISVSEQPLPANFKDDPAGQVAKLAQSFAANDKVMAGHTAAYIGTSIKGPQSVITTQGNLLILIRSDSKISDPHWVNYITNLQ